MEKENIFKKIRFMRPLYAQITFVLLAFALMVVSSSFIMFRTLNEKLEINANNSMDDLQSYMSYTLQGPALALDFISKNIRAMYVRGESFEAIKAYMEFYSSPELKSTITMFDYYSVYGYYEVFDKFHDGGGWVAAADFVVKERPWYIAAVAGGGNVVVSPPYIDADSNTPVLAYARRMFDDNGAPVGVVCLDVPIDYIAEMMNKSITEGSYILLVDEQSIVIAHPEAELIGENIHGVTTVFTGLSNYIIDGTAFSMLREKNHMGVDSVIFGRPLDNGWYVSLVIPESEYYGDLFDMILFVSILGTVLALVFILIIVRIEKAKNKADEANRQKSSFLATMSHEIRTPMNVILGITENRLLSDYISKEAREDYEKIYNSGDILLRIINDILDLSKIEAGKLELMVIKYEVSSLINDAVHLNMMRFDHKPIAFKLSVDEKLPLQLYGDELRIKQILNNLLSNAFKYTNAGEVTLSFEAEEAGENQLILVLRVTDTGQGMTKEQIDLLFDEFARFNLEANRTTIGAGLGMTITHNLVNIMKGDITVYSEPGQGSTFTVRLPQRKNGSVPMGKELAESLTQLRYSNVTQMNKHKITREHMSYGKVLIVDDMPPNIDVARMMLIPYGLKIDTAESGRDAIDIIKSGNVYDIVFMDHMMPNMDGIETVKHIRAFGYHHPIVALTANALTGQADVFVQNGFDGFISKPIDVREMNATLNRLIRDKQPPEILNAARKRMAEEDNLPVNPKEEQVRIDIPGVDTEQALNLYDDDMEIYLFALRAYATKIPVALEKMRIVTSERLHEYTTLVHGLKGSSSSIGASSLEEKAYALELLAKSGNVDEVCRLNNDLILETEKLLTDLKNWLRTIENTEND